jgi:hypothetical protein
MLFFIVFFVVCPTVLGQTYTTTNWTDIDPPGAVGAYAGGIYKNTVIINWSDSTGKSRASVWKNGNFTEIVVADAFYDLWLQSIWESTIVGCYVDVNHLAHWFTVNDNGSGFSLCNIQGNAGAIHGQKMVGAYFSDNFSHLYVSNMDGSGKTVFNGYQTTFTTPLCMGGFAIGGECIRYHSGTAWQDGFICGWDGLGWKTINPVRVVVDPTVPHYTTVSSVGDDGLLFGSYDICGDFGTRGFICDSNGNNWFTIEYPNHPSGTVVGITVYGRYQDKFVGYHGTPPSGDGSNHAYIATIPQLSPKRNAANPNWRMYE